MKSKTLIAAAVFAVAALGAMAEFKATGTSLCVAFGNHDSEQPESDKAFVSRQEQYDWYKASLGSFFPRKTAKGRRTSSCPPMNPSRSRMS